MRRDAAYIARRLTHAALLALAATISACAPATAVVRAERVPSRAMGREWPAVVVLPPAYEAEGDRRFGVVYLLHGANGDQWSWVRNSPLERHLETRDVICVIPFGRSYGWWLDSPRLSHSQLETFLVEELVPYIDATYRTDARCESRAVCGFSMGGHGALTLAARHPDVFSSASSIAGIMDLARWPGEWCIANVLGPRDENADLWRVASAAGQAHLFAGAARGVRIMTDCGTGDFAHPENVAFHEQLESLGVAHTYVERPGSHTWQYWTSVIDDHLDFHLVSFARAPTGAEHAPSDGRDLP